MCTCLISLFLDRINQNKMEGWLRVPNGDSLKKYCLAAGDLAQFMNDLPTSATRPKITRNVEAVYEDLGSRPTFPRQSS